jgi:hypothetical protein
MISTLAVLRENAMNKSRLIFAALAAIGLAMTGCAHVDSQMAAQRAQNDIASSASASELPNELRLNERVAALQPKITAKLNKKPLLARMGEVAKWQERWGGRVAPDGRFDEPQGRLTHFLAKRLPEGGATSLSPSDYLSALEQASTMPVYSTFEGRFVAPENVQTPVPGSGSVVSAVGPGLGGTWSAMGPGNIGGRTRAILASGRAPTVAPRGPRRRI